MRHVWVYLGVVVLVIGVWSSIEAQTSEVTMNQVSVPFHAADLNGVPIRNIVLSDLQVLDNDKRPKQIVSFEAYKNLPVRAGILMDASKSALEDLPHNEKIAREYVDDFLRAGRDQAFVTRFDAAARVEQGWTADRHVLAKGIRKVGTDTYTKSGTAVFDAIYKTCLDQFSHAGARTGNFILLLSDGDDNASRTWQLKDDVEECQRANTAIYVISSDPQGWFYDTDPELQKKLMEIKKTVLDLAALTGGKVFFNQTPEEIRDDLRFIVANTRLQYRVVYKPAELKTDGSFHKIELESPKRGGDITTWTGYYAPQ
jgi:Ca-activated chloride channel family protein